MRNLSLLALTLSTELLWAAPNCDKARSEVNQFADVDQLVDHLKTGVQQQKDLTELFQCLTDPQRLPTDLMDADRDFIYGDGWGSAFANSDVPFWNEFQSKVGRAIWGGKILRTTDTGATLLNVMRDRKTLAYAAQVHADTSIVDGGESIVLDYRQDTTVPLISSLLVSRVRDEIREITFQGFRSGVYLGRAYLFTGLLNDRFSPAWSAAGSFAFAANFLLDFRAARQDEIPEWILR